jgi:hypothetical protein
MNYKLFFAFVELGISAHFFYRIIFRKENGASNGFGAAVFLIAFWINITPFLKDWAKAFF